MPQINDIGQGQVIGYKSKSKSIWQACVKCGKERWVPLRAGKPAYNRCHICAMGIDKRGAKAHNWKGGRYTGQDGYIQIKLQPDDFFYPMTDKNNYVREHRLVVAKALGRNLHRWEIVHHKGIKYPRGSIENKQDNRYPENLQLANDIGHKQITQFEKTIEKLEREIIFLKVENRKLNRATRVKSNDFNCRNLF